MCKILIVDNDAVSLDTLKAALSAYNITTVTKYSDAFGAYDLYKPDISIVSASMDNYAGLSVIHHIADNGGGTMPSRLCAMLDSYDLKNTNAAYSAGANDIFVKPLHVNYVVMRIQDMYASYRLYKLDKLNAFKWNTLLDLFPDPVTITKYSNGEYIYVNQAYRDRISKPIERIIGNNAIDIGVMSNLERRKLIAALADTGFVKNMELEYLSNGATYNISISAQVFEVDGTKYILSVARDLTEQKKMMARNSVLRAAVDHTAFRDRLAKMRSTTEELQDRARFIQAGEVILPDEYRSPSRGDEEATDS